MLDLANTLLLLQTMTAVDDGTTWLAFANERVKGSEVNNVIIDQQHNPFEGERGTTGQDAPWPRTSGGGSG